MAIGARSQSARTYLEKHMDEFLDCKFRTNDCQACDFSGFFLVSGFFFTRLPLLTNVLERREVATKESKK